MEAKKTKSWTAKDYIVLALSVILAISIVTTIIVIVLSPVDIKFSVTHAWNWSDKSGHDGRYLNITIAANNSGSHTKVSYQSFFVDLRNNSGAGGATSDAGDWIHATVLDPKPNKKNFFEQGPKCKTVIRSSVFLVEGTEWIGGVDNGDGFAVVVMAQVRFKVGVAPSRVYDIKVSCYPVIFGDENSRMVPVGCK
ncbi:hypothetical protein ACP4OV_030578 [Aristida adscensionis]